MSHRRRDEARAEAYRVLARTHGVWLKPDPTAATTWRGKGSGFEPNPTSPGKGSGFSLTPV